MESFVATYTNARGQERQLQLRAASMAEARRNLRRRGIRPINVEPVTEVAAATGRPAGAAAAPRSPAGSRSTAPSSSGSSLARLLEAKPGIKEKALFASKLSAMVTAGVPIVRSLSMMSAQQKMPVFKKALEAIAADVNQGSSLGAALRKWPDIFDRLSVAMIDAGEAGGVLDETLKRLAKLLEDNAKLQNQIKSALGYPTTVLIIAILVFLGMTMFLIPTFANIFDELGAELPAFTQMLVNLSSLLRSYFSLLFVAGLAIGIWLFMNYYATPPGRRQVDAFILKVPLFGDLIQKTSTAQFCRTFSSLSRAGVPILLTLEITRETTSNSIISDAIRSTRNEVMEGIPLSVALARKQVFPEMAINMLTIGEETGGLDAMLSKVADFYEDEVESTVKVLTSMIEPMMIVLVGGIVGSVLLAMYLPMFSIFEKIR